jgi:uncharacterized protein (AIM24 family)
MKLSPRLAVHVRALGLAVALLALPGCTLFDFWPEGGLEGQPFTPDQPEGEVTLSGVMNSDRIVVAREGCTPGNTFFWGQVTNTGDMDVTSVSISITVLDGAGRQLGTWSAPVYNGEVEEIKDADGNVITTVAGTFLAVDSSGTFTVCTSVPFGTAGGTEYHTSFVEVEGSTQ